MKKTVFAFLLLTVSASVFSQAIHIGANAGVGTAWHNHLHTNYSNRFFLFHSYGLSVQQTRSEHLSFGADLNYSFEGSSLYFQRHDLPPQSYQVKSRLHYLRLPLKATYTFGNPSAPIRPLAYLAPTLGYLVAGKSEGMYLHSGGVERVEDNITRKHNSRLDYGLQGGAGFSFRLSNVARLNTTVNYFHGLPNTWGGLQKNRNASFNAGLLWRLKHS